MNNNRIWLSLAHMGGAEQKYIQEAFDTNRVVPLGTNVVSSHKQANAGTYYNALIIRQKSKKQPASADLQLATYNL